jgi:PPM family protein phosphatase
MTVQCLVLQRKRSAYESEGKGWPSLPELAWQVVPADGAFLVEIVPKGTSQTGVEDMGRCYRHRIMSPYRICAGSTPYLEYATASAMGSCRPFNEDAFAYFPEVSVFLVVDGCGGGDSETNPAHRIVTSMREFLSKTVTFEAFPMDPLAQAIQFAHLRLHQQLQTNPHEFGSGATLCALRCSDSWCTLAHVGDCRIGEFVNQQFSWLTEDHDLPAALRKQGISSAEIEQQTAHFSHILTRSIGLNEVCEIDIRYRPLNAPTLYLLCSDGLSRQVSNSHIGELLSNKQRSLQERCQDLVQAAEQAGGHDNTTVMLVQTQEKLC